MILVRVFATEVFKINNENTQYWNESKVIFQSMFRQIGVLTGQSVLRLLLPHERINFNWREIWKKRIDSIDPTFLYPKDFYYEARESFGYKKATLPCGFFNLRVEDGIRTRDFRHHKPAL